MLFQKVSQYFHYQGTDFYLGFRANDEFVRAEVMIAEMDNGYHVMVTNENMMLVFDVFSDDMSKIHMEDGFTLAEFMDAIQ